MISVPLKRSRRPVYEIDFLKDGGTISMAVDGSSVAKTYSFSPNQNIWAVESLAICLVDPGTTAPTAFGAITGPLTNGVALEVQSAGDSRQISLLKTNIDISIVFNEDQIFSQVLDSLNNPVGWMNRIDFYIATIKFENPIILFSAQSDYIRAKVQDDLTGLETFHIKYKAWRELL